VNRLLSNYFLVFIRWYLNNIALNLGTFVIRLIFVTHVRWQVGIEAQRLKTTSSESESTTLVNFSHTSNTIVNKFD
jgi:hypothetical protein